MKKKLSDYFYQTKKLISFVFLFLFIGVLFLPSTKIKANEKDVEITFFINPEESYVKAFDYGDEILEYHTFEFAIFEGWYDNSDYTGDNYYGLEVDEFTPNVLYLKAILKLDEDIYNGFTFEQYLDGYKITSYSGTHQYLKLPSYYYEENEHGVYEIKDVIKVDEGTFTGNDFTLTLTVPNTIEEISLETFKEFESLVEVYINEGNSNYSSDMYGFLYNADQTELLYAPVGSYVNSFTTPVSLELIKEGSIKGLPYLHTIIISSTLLTIEQYGITLNENLEKIIIESPSDVNINSYGIANNESLVFVSIPNSVTTVGEDIFTNSSNNLKIYYEGEDLPLTWDELWNSDDYEVVLDYGNTYFTVTFVDDEDNVIEEQQVIFGGSATAPVDVSKEDDLENEYHFGGWENDFSRIYGDTTIRAYFYSNPKYYTITFYDSDDNVYGTQEVRYGENPNNNFYFTDIKKEEDDEYTYKFLNWTPDLTMITGDVDAYPVFEAIKKTYVVVFYWNDDQGWFHYEDVYYGETVNEPVDSPVKDTTHMYEYTFDGWFYDIEKTIPYDSEAPVTKFTEVYPKFIESLRMYSVIFYNYNNQIYAEKFASYGEAAEAPADPVRQSSAQYDYIFMGWDTDFSNVTNRLIVYPIFDAVVREYTVVFYDYEGTPLKTEVLEYGSSATPPENVTRPSTPKYHYEFNRWDGYYNFISGDLELHPIFDSDLRQYTVNFYADDEVTLLKTEDVYYGFSAYAPYPPHKPSTDEYQYTFIGWDKEFNEITEEIDVYAIYEATTRSYKVYFYHDDGYTLLAERNVLYGSAAATPDEPTKENTQEFSYTFYGWDKEFNNITETTYVYAIFTSVVNKYTYTFYDDDRTTILKTDTIDYGNLIEAPTDPIKESTQQYVYTFSNWDKSFNTITNNIDIYAVYSYELQEYTVTFYDEDEETILKGPEIVKYGNGVTAPVTPTKESTAQYDYEFNGWSTNYTNIVADTNIYATYKSTIRSYSVYFYNEAGDVLIKTDVVTYGTSATAPTDPTKPSTEQYNYIFDGWDKEFDNITETTFVYATFESVIRKYTVTFYEADLETVLVSEEVEYGSSPLNTLIPIKESTNEYSYIFTGWDKSYSFITGDLDLYPEFISSPVLYDVTYETFGGSLIESHEQGFNTYLNRPTNPTKVGHNFIGWYKEAGLINEFLFTAELMPASDITLYAKFIKNEYTIRFNSNGGTQVIDVTEVYNNPITLDTPSKRGFTFDGWYIDNEYEVEFTFEFMPGQDYYLYAKWNINQYTMSFNTNGGSLINDITQNYASAITEPDNPVKEGHMFIGWYLDEELTNRYYISMMPAEDITLYARWQTNYYMLSYETNGGSTINSRYVLYNTLIPLLVEPTKVGYSFVGWFSDSSLTTIFEQVLMPSHNVTIYAKWEVNSYSVSFNSNGGSLVDSITSEYNSLILKPNDPTKVGHTFDGWYKEADLINVWDFLEDVISNRNITLYAKWTLNEYTLTFNSNGGSSVSDITLSYGTTITSPISIKEGYKLVGWYIDEELEVEFIFDYMPASDMTLYAKWSLEDYIVYLDVDNGDFIEDLVLNYLDEIVLPIPTKTGYSFVGWYIDINYTEEFSITVMPNSNLYAYAKFIVNEYTLTFNSNGGTLIDPLTKQYNDDIILSSPTKEGSTFSGWYIDSELQFEFTSLTMPAEDLTLYARWVTNGYTITFNSNGGSYVYPIIEEYETEISAPSIPTKTGQKFLGWYIDEELEVEFIFDYMPSSNITLYAKWENEVYVVTFYDEDGVTYLGESSGVYGFNATAPDTPIKQSTQQYSYTFDGWSQSINNVRSNLSVTATYKATLRQYKVTFYSTEYLAGVEGDLLSFEYVYYGNGINPPQITPTKSNTAQYEYIFIGWSEDYTYITGELNIYPVFDEVLRKYVVNFYNEGLLHDTQEVLYGSNANTPVTPTKESTQQYVYEFNSWSEDYTNITGNLGVYANFTSTVRKYTVNFYNEGILHDTQEVAYGNNAVMPVEPVKEPTVSEVFTFSGWDVEFNNITNNLDVYAQYITSTRKYTVRFFVGDDLYDTQEVAYQSSAIMPVDPTKESTAQYNYIFAGWNKEFNNITSNLDLYANFTSVVRKYTVNFYNEGILHDTQEVAYGNSAVMPVDPIKEPTVSEVFTFSGWDVEFNNITNNLDVYATYTSSARKYTVSFYNESILYDTQEVAYGTSAHVIEEPVKESINEYYYVFVGWDKDFSNIVSNLSVYALYESYPNEYTMSFNTGGGTSISDITYNYGSPVSEPVSPTKVGHIFTGWYTSEDLLGRYTFNLMPARDVTVYAGWITGQYKITYNSNGGTQINQQTRYYNSTINAPVEPLKEGYVFSGWYKDSDLTEEFIFDKMLGYDFTLYAKWSLGEFTITFNSNEGTLVDPLTNYYLEEIEAPEEPIRDGYYFDGWYIDRNFNNLYEFNLMPSNNITLYAKWALKSYTITFDSNGGSSVNPIVLNYGSVISAPSAPIKAGYSFVGWYKDSNLNEPYIFILMGHEDITLYAKWEANKYKVYFDSDGGSLVEELTVAYEEDIPTIVDPTKVGHTFSGWYEGEELYVFGKMPNQNVYLKAKWEVNEYTMSFNTGGGTLVESITLFYGEVISEPVDPTKVGHTFSGWYKDDLLYTITTMPAEDITLAAKYTINSYEITFETNGGTPINNKIFEYQQVIEIEGPLKEEHLFKGWYLDSELTIEFTLTKMPDSNLKLYAKWELITYTITFNSNGGSLIDDVVKGFNEPITLIEPTKKGYTFNGWYTDAELTAEFTSLTMPKYDLTLYAKWSLEEFTITFDSNGGSDVNPITKNYLEEVTEPVSPTRVNYVFKGWYLDEELYIFDKMPNENIILVARWALEEFTVKFYNDDQTYLGEVIVSYGNDAIFNDPIKESTKQYHFEFDGWSPDITNVTSDLSVYATYIETLRQYRVTFYNDEEGTENNQVIHLNNYFYGSSVTAPSAPFKPSTQMYVYEFSGWSEDYTFVDEDLVIYPVYTKTLRVYTVKFIQDDYQTIIEEVLVNYGEAAVAPSNPTKDSTDTYTYIFSGWDKDFSNIVGNLNVYASYERTLRIYTVKFYSEGILLKTEEVAYLKGATPPANPSKNQTNQYTYRFIGWDKEFNSITNNIEVNALYEAILRQHSVYFYDDDKATLLDVVTVYYGEDAISPGDPVKQSTEQYDFIFTGWDRSIENITGTMLVYATYEEVLRSYLVQFFDDNNNLLKEETVFYGSSATPPVVPEKEATEEYYYVFSRWSIDYTFVDASIQTHAVYEAIRNKYTVNFYDADNNLIKSSEVTYGADATAPQVPVKEKTDKYKYIFTSWSEDFSNVTSDLDIYPLYEESLREFTVRFYSEEELVNTQNVLYGNAANMPNDPYKPRDDKYNYTFSNWDKDFSSITNDLDVYAVYDKDLREFTVRFYKDNIILETITVSYGSDVVAPTNTNKASSDKYDYTFIGWDKELTNIISSIDIYAVYEESLREFIVSFYNEGVLIKEELVIYGNDVVAPVDPTKESTPRYHYEFDGWDKDLTNITSNITVYATYKNITRSYTVKFYNDDILLKTEEVLYGSDATPPSNPTKENTDKYRYVFKGWNNSYINITNNLDVKATYDEFLREFTIVFYDEDRVTILKTERVFYGSDATPPTDPVKESTSREDYIFSGWDKDYQNIKSSFNIYATYEGVLRSYTVKFYNSDDEVIKTEEVLYGSSATAPEVPIKEGTDKYSYIFTSWSRTFNNVTGNINVYPRYDEVINKYTVKFYVDDTLIKEETLEYGNSATAPEAYKESSNKYDYIFESWDKEFDNIEGDLNVYAIFTEELRVFVVRFYGDDQFTLIDEQVVTYGFDALAPTVNPTKESSNLYHYEFDGWDKDFTNITTNLNIYPLYNEHTRYYKVNFYVDDVLINEIDATYGESLISVTDPIKEGNEVYYYKFVSWSEDLSYIISDLDVDAIFEELHVEYTVRFYSDDNKTLYKTTKVYYGEDATPPSNPVKESTDKYDYIFIRWDKEFSNIKEDINVYAVFEETLKTFTVRFYNDDVLYETQEVLYGEDVVAPVDPTKESSEMYKYIFSGWDKDLNNITSDVRINAIYTEQYNEYTIKFYNALDEVIKEEVLVYGTLIVPIEGPDKDTDHQYIYTFTRWTGYIEGMIVTKDISFKPEYETEDVYYTVIVIVDNKEHEYEIAYDGAFPNVDNLKETSNKYIYNAVGAYLLDELISIPKVVKEDITITIVYESYLRRSYFENYLRSINFDSLRAYNSLKEAYNLLSEASEDDYDYLYGLFEEKVIEYNNVVDVLDDELQVVMDHQAKIFEGIIGVISVFSNFNYLYVFFNRKGFIYA